MNIYFSVSCTGVEEHISYVRGELRGIQRLGDELARLIRRADAAQADPAPLRDSADLLGTVMESMDKRISFLQSLLDDVRLMNEEADAIVGDMLARGEEYGE